MIGVKKTTNSIPVKKIKNQNFTGVGNDKPGPDSYQPEVRAIKRNTNYATFGMFKDSRKGKK